MITSRLNSNRVRYGVVLVLCAVCLAASAAADLTMNWWTCDSGGGLWSAAGGLELSGTIGQPDAGGVLSGGGLTLAGGFWPGVGAGVAPPVCRGDLDCNGQVDFQDINPFVLYLSNHSVWLATYPCSAANGDINGDGTYGASSFGDINAFVTLLSTSSLPIVCAPPACVGDLDCNGQIEFADINPFVLYLSNHSAWQATYNCNAANGDINGDGTYGAGSFGDINPFVTLLTTHSLPMSCP